MIGNVASNGLPHTELYSSRMDVVRSQLHKNAKILFAYNKKRYMGIVVEVGRKSVLVNFKMHKKEMTRRVRLTRILHVVTR